MIPYKPYRETAVPKTLETRLEIMKAIRTLAVQDEDEQRRRADIAALRRDLEQIAQDLRKTCREWASQVQSELRLALQKYDPDQPRVPAGNPDGGHWTGEGESVSSSDTATRSGTRAFSV
jgi:hypothetical protein